VASHFRSLTVKDIRKETDDCVSIAFEIPDQWKEEFKFKQGQNITVRTSMEGEEIRRSYSICSSPLDNELRIAVKKIPNGKFSRFASQRLKKNSTLDVLPPTGLFFTELQRSNKKNYLAFAAGSGITPVISIIKTTLATEPESSFTLIYGNRNRNCIIFKEELEGVKNKYIDRFSIHYILSREKTDAALNQGRIDAGKCELLFTHFVDPRSIDEFFICGPEEMIFSIKNWLESKGIEKKKIHFELFTVPGQKNKPETEETVITKKAKSENSRITIRLDGIAFDFDLGTDDEPILDAALKQGADLPYACKGGVCASCRAKLIAGKVEMENNYALEPEELEAGFILTCQSHPRSEKVVIDFDMRH